MRLNGTGQADIARWYSEKASDFTAPPKSVTWVRSTGHYKACGGHVFVHRGRSENHTTKMGGAGSVCFTATVAPTSSDEVSARRVRKLASSVPEGSRTR